MVSRFVGNVGMWRVRGVWRRFPTGRVTTPRERGVMVFLHMVKKDHNLPNSAHVIINDEPSG